MHQSAGFTYPGLEKEQLEPNIGILPMPCRTPANSPLGGRQQKPGASQGPSTASPADT
jgi:hypothetical protein